MEVIFVEPGIKLMTDSEVIEGYPRFIEEAGRTCYQSHEKMTEESHERFCRMLRGNGHLSVFEHCQISVRITTDRATAQQITRHRLCAYSMESQRYCGYAGQLKVIIPEGMHEGGKLDRVVWTDAVQYAAEAYGKLLAQGRPPEVARSVLPNCTATEIVMSANVRQWRWIFTERAVNRRAQKDVRRLFGILLRVLTTLAPPLFDDLVPFVDDLPSRYRDKQNEEKDP